MSLSLSTIRYKLGLLMALTVFAASTIAPSEAEAQTAALSVRVILASNSGGGMDGALGSMSSQLRSRFSSYNSFRQLSRHSVSISSSSSRSVSLPNGSTMTIQFLGMSGSSYRLQISLPGGGTTVTAPPGGRFFVAGPSYQGGMLIIAITP